jgi:hypothetical protein
MQYLFCPLDRTNVYIPNLQTLLATKAYKTAHTWLQTTFNYLLKSLFMTLSVTQTTHIASNERKTVNNEFQKTWKQLWPNFKVCYNPGICLKVLRKNHEKSRQDSRSLGRYAYISPK